MKRDSFVFYRSFYEAIKDLDNDTKADFLDAICEYALNGEDTSCDKEPMIKAMFTILKPTIDSNNNKYINGKKGGRPAKPKDKENKSKVIKEETNGLVKDNLGIEKSKPNVDVDEDVDEEEDVDTKEFSKQEKRDRAIFRTKFCIAYKNKEFSHNNTYYLLDVDGYLVKSGTYSPLDNFDAVEMWNALFTRREDFKI